jgi:hypothetical protein
VEANPLLPLLHRGWAAFAGGVLLRDTCTEKLLARLAGSAALAALIGGSYVVFRVAFGVSYFRWYIENGAVLGLVLAAAAVGLNLDAEDGLISSRPDLYLASWMLIPANMLLQLSAVLSGPRTFDHTPEAQSSSSATPDTGKLKAIVEILALVVAVIFMGEAVTFLIILGLIVLLIVWIIVVAPLQFFVFLICGAPARSFRNTVWSDEGLPRGALGSSNAFQPPPSRRAQRPAKEPRLLLRGYGRRCTRHGRFRSRPRSPRLHCG